MLASVLLAPLASFGKAQPCMFAAAAFQAKPQAPAPETTPPPDQQPAQNQSGSSQSSSTPETTVPNATTSATAKKKRPRKHKTAANSKPAKVVVQNGGTSDPKVQLTPGVSAQQASSAQNSVNQLLNTTDEDLKKASDKQLNANQQDIVTQIHMFEEQARDALAAGDLQRAHNLAVKANLLAAELVKP